MTDDRQEAIFKRLKELFKDLKYGELTVKFTVHKENATKGEVIDERKSLG